MSADYTSKYDLFIHDVLAQVMDIAQAKLPSLRLWMSKPELAMDDGWYLYALSDEVVSRVVVFRRRSGAQVFVGLEGEIGEEVHIEDIDRMARLFVESCKTEMDGAK